MTLFTSGSEVTVEGAMKDEQDKQKQQDKKVKHGVFSPSLESMS